MTNPVIVEDNSPEQSQLLNNTVDTFTYFASPVYKINKPEYLNDARIVMKELIEEIKKDRKLNSVYPVYQTRHMIGDPRITALSDYIGGTAWNVLESQGYNMQGLSVTFQEFWGQEHYKHSLHEEHVHGNGCQIVGFYFLDIPKDSSRLIIHDPRPAKRIINLPEVDMSQITFGTTTINFEPIPGDLFFVPSYVPHSFGRHANKNPIRFIHFTIGVSARSPNFDIDNGDTTSTNAEII